MAGSNSLRPFDMSASLPTLRPQASALSVQSVLMQEAEPREIVFLPCLGTPGSPDLISLVARNSRVRRQLLSLTRLHYLRLQRRANEDGSGGASESEAGVPGNMDGYRNEVCHRV